MFGIVFYFFYIFFIYLIPTFFLLENDEIIIYSLFVSVWSLFVIFFYIVGLAFFRNVSFLSIIETSLNLQTKLRNFVLFVFLFILIFLLFFELKSTLGMDLLDRVTSRENGFLKQFISTLILVISMFFANAYSRIFSLTFFKYLLLLLLLQIFYFYIYFDRSIILFSCAIFFSYYWWGNYFSFVFIFFAKGLLDILNSLRWQQFDAISVQRFIEVTFDSNSKTLVYFLDSIRIYLKDGTFPDLLVNSILLPIPKFIWSSKPPLSPTLFLSDYYGYHDGIGRPIAVFGEFLLSGGVVGFLFGALFTGIIFSFIDRFPWRLLKNNRSLHARSTFWAVIFLGGVGLSTFTRILPVLFVLSFALFLSNFYKITKNIKYT